MAGQVGPGQALDPLEDVLYDFDDQEIWDPWVGIPQGQLGDRKGWGGDKPCCLLPLTFLSTPP